MTMILRTIFSTAIRRTFALVSFLVFLLTFGATHASTLTGRVVDLETGRPLVGVNVRVQGIGQGSSSSDNGAYNIEGLTPGTYVVVFSHVGYQWTFATHAAGVLIAGLMAIKMKETLKPRGTKPAEPESFVAEHAGGMPP